MWILDTKSDLGKISSIQVAILMNYAKSGEEPKKITDILAVLKEAFKGYWEPKKGTIYPAVHNLHIRGFLKAHAIKPYGYSITDKGLEVIHEMISNINLQMEAYMQYYSFLIDNYEAIDPKMAKKTRNQIIKSIDEYTKTIKE